MDQKEIERFYDLLGHEKETEIRAIELSKDFKTSKVKGHFFVNSKGDFLTKVKELNGKYNLYAGLNERREKGTEAKDVLSVKKIFIDIDCIKKPAIEEDIKEAEKVTDNIINIIENKTGLRPSKIFSGNGFQLLYTIPKTKITDDNREDIQGKIQQFMKDLIKEFSNDKVKLDNVGDLPRIIRITGTVNVKGGNVSRFVEFNDQENQKLLDYIMNLKPKECLDVGGIDTSLKEIIEKDEIVKDLFEGDIKKFASRSEAELSLVSRLISLGLDKSNIFKVMASCKIGKWQEANVQYRDLTYKKALEIIKNEKHDKTSYKKIKLSDLNANLINQFVEVDCQITGEQLQKAIPLEIEILCETCGKSKFFNSLDNPEIFILDRETRTILQELKNRFMCDCSFNDNTPRKISKIRSYVDYSILFVRDLLDRDSLSSIKRYEAKKIYVINQLLPNAKTVNLKGRVIIEPKSKNISIMCDYIKHLENQVDDFKISDEFKESSKKYFRNSDEVHRQINPDIVGKARETAKQSISLQLHSPCKIYDITRKKLIRGGLNVIFYGDTKCGKSELTKDITQKGSMPIAEYTICETGGRTGFLYTIDRDKGSLIWGSLALNDMGLVVLDGLQSMHSEELGEFREAIEQQEIIVRRSLSGEALARTRILGSLNPNSPMVNYLYKCKGLQDTYVFAKSPEFTRWDVFIPFSQRDVSGKEISHRKSEDKPIPDDVFMKHVYWAWSRKPEQIIYTDSAINRINDMSEEFINDYSLETLPIVHNGIRDILTRLSVAMASQMHSTDEDHEKIIVESEHVSKAVKWYKEVLEMIELSRYKQDIEGKTQLTDSDCVLISKELGKVEWEILEEIKHEGKSSSQLSETLELVPKTIKEHYKPLQKHGLIEASKGKGINLSVKGIKFIRWGMSQTGNLVTNSVTNENIGNKKSDYLPREKKGLDKYSIEKETEKIDFNELEGVFQE